MGSYKFCWKDSKQSPALPNKVIKTDQNELHIHKKNKNNWANENPKSEITISFKWIKFLEYMF